MFPPQVTEVSSATTWASAVGLRAGDPPGDDAPVFRTSLEPFWPSRRAHAYDQFCR
jgi:hypothetical protein